MKEDQKLDLILGQLAEAKLPQAPANLESNILRSIRLFRDDEGAAAKFRWWGLPQLGAAACLVALLAGFLGGKISQPEPVVANNGMERIVDLDVFDLEPSGNLISLVSRP